MIAPCSGRGIRTKKAVSCFRILHETKVAQDGILRLVLLNNLIVGLGAGDGLEPIGGGGIDGHRGRKVVVDGLNEYLLSGELNDS